MRNLSEMLKLRLESTPDEHGATRLLDLGS